MSQILGKVLARWWSEVRKGGDLRIKGTLSQFTIACLLYGFSPDRTIG